MRLRIVLVSSEVTPFSKTGGLADVTSALAACLQARGHDVRVYTPLHSTIDRARHGIVADPSRSGLPLEWSDIRLRYGIAHASLPGSGLRIDFIDCPALYARRSLYTQDADEHVRFIALARAVFDQCQRDGFAPDILHAHDWHAAWMPLLQKAAFSWDRLFARSRSVLTIHNIGYQGVFPASRVPDLGLVGRTDLLHQDDLRAGLVNSLKHGVLYADAITTVSPTYAREILTDEYGMGLQDVLATRADALTGILNGVDYAVWDPRTDPHLPIHYDAAHLGAKAQLKSAFAGRLGLSVAPRRPLFGIVSRLVAQKGFELLFDTLPPLLEEERLALAVLGNGDARDEAFFTALARAYPSLVDFRRGYDEAHAHWIEAASDFFLMPSLYEPCGLNQMYSLRYGTLPIVRRTGGLADSVEHYDPATRQGNGIVFNDFDPGGMGWALGQALELYEDGRALQRARQNAMAKDYSWPRQCAAYERVYARVLATVDASSPG